METVEHILNVDLILLSKQLAPVEVFVDRHLPVSDELHNQPEQAFLILRRIFRIIKRHILRLGEVNLPVNHFFPHLVGIGFRTNVVEFLHTESDTRSCGIVLFLSVSLAHHLRIGRHDSPYQKANRKYVSKTSHISWHKISKQLINNHFHRRKVARYAVGADSLDTRDIEPLPA